MNLNSVQDIIELSDAQFESILGAEVSIRSLITQKTSVPLLKRSPFHRSIGRLQPIYRQSAWEFRHLAPLFAAFYLKNESVLTNQCLL